MGKAYTRKLSEGEAINTDGQMMGMDPAHMSDRKFTEEMEDEEARDDVEGE